MSTAFRPMHLMSSVVISLSLWGVTVSFNALAQIRDLDVNTPAPALMTSPANGSAPLADPQAPVQTSIDLGQDMAPASTTKRPLPASKVMASRPSASSAATAAARLVKPAVKSGAGSAVDPADTKRRALSNAETANMERVIFARLPIRVSLPVGRERLITLPGPAALHVPDDIEAVARIESIDRTLYVTALVPFAPIRVVAELIAGGQQIPIDLTASGGTLAVAPELEIFLSDPAIAEAAPGASASDQPSNDMVDLTRYASRMLYAPRRLAQPVTGISQVQLAKGPVPSLLRGALVETAPLGQWRSADLYVTALRVTSKSKKSQEIILENLRGHWLAATAQHGVIGPAGSDTDTTAIYLICDRAFESCL